MSEQPILPSLEAVVVREAIDPTNVGDREPRGYVATLTIANIGVLIALITPIIVSLAFKLQHISASPEEGTSALGITLGLGAMVGMVVNPLAGRLSDRTMSRFGRRRPWVVSGMLVAFAALVGIGFAPEIWMVMVLWCVVQAGVSMATAAMNATIPEQVPAHRRGLVSGLMGVGTSIAILGGISLTQTLSEDWLRFSVPGAIGVILVAVFALILPDHPRTAPPTHRFSVREFLGSFVFDPRQWPDFGWVWLSKFCVIFGHIGVASFLPLYLTERFELGEQEAITVILFSNLAATATGLISGIGGGLISDRLGRRRVFVLAAGFITAAGLLLLGFAPGTTVVIIAQAIIGFGSGAFFSVDTALATQTLPKTGDTAKDLGVLNIANTLPQSIGPILATPIIALGAGTAIGGHASFYVVGATITLVGAVLVLNVKGVR
ncbi:MFS transporter [Nocardia asteroides]|uniref:MFS transporter n=1 Tax=Nocardia asteroides TaxID=1824 RepID=UPI0033E3374B